jgi:hypothetical protein
VIYYASSRAGPCIATPSVLAGIFREITRTPLYSSLFKASVMASSKSSAWHLAHAATNAYSPSDPRVAATVRSCSARLVGGRDQPISSRSAATVPHSHAARSILPLRYRYSGQLLQAG